MYAGGLCLKSSSRQHLQYTRLKLQLECQDLGVQVVSGRILIAELSTVHVPCNNSQKRILNIRSL